MIVAEFNVQLDTCGTSLCRNCSSCWLQTI